MHHDECSDAELSSIPPLSEPAPMPPPIPMPAPIPMPPTFSPPRRDSFPPSPLPRLAEFDGRAGPRIGIARSAGIGSRSSARRMKSRSETTRSWVWTGVWPPTRGRRARRGEMRLREHWPPDTWLMRRPDCDPVASPPTWAQLISRFASPRCAPRNWQSADMRGALMAPPEQAEKINLQTGFGYGHFY